MPLLVKSAIISSVSRLASTHSHYQCLSVQCEVLSHEHVHTYTNCEAGGRFNGGEGHEWFLCCDSLKLNNLSFQLALKNML